MKKEKIYTDDTNVEVRLQGTNTDSLEKEAVDYCPGCNVAYCHGRYTTGQCEWTTRA